jgi:chitinase
VEARCTVFRELRSRGANTATATATATTSSGGGSSFPARFAAPYVATWNTPDLAALASSTGHKFWTLAFIINGPGSCNPMWNGDTALTTTYNVSGLRVAGGDLIVSFGGASGTEIAASCADVAPTQAAYQRVIDAVGARALDLDIESGFESDAASIDRRNKAMHNLQAANPGLRVDYTLGVDRAGLPAAQLNVLSNARANGVMVSSVNIMAMDYGPCYSDMGQAAVDAANATKTQLAAIGINANVGVTPMIGVNDVSCENFTTNDASVLVNDAQGLSYINLLACWVQDADPSHAYINIFKTFH